MMRYKGENPTKTKVRASLVKTRKIIADKFRKLHQSRVLGERKSQVKYAPITNTLLKMIKQKEAIQQNQQIIQDDVNPFERMDVDPDPHHFPLSLASPTITQRPLIPPRPHQQFSTKRMNKREDENSVTEVRNKNSPFRQFFDNILENCSSSKRNSKKRRGSIGSSDSEIDIFNVAEYKNDSKTRRRNQEIVENEYNSEDGAYGGVNNESIRSSLSNKSVNRDPVDDPSIANRSQRYFNETDDQDAIVSPEDYDKFGKFRGYGPKRRKVTVALRNLERTLYKMKQKKWRDENRNINSENVDYHDSKMSNMKRYASDIDHRKVKRMLRKEETRSGVKKNHTRNKLNDVESVDLEKYFSVLSPDDFDENGHFRGPGPKRRKVAIHTAKINDAIRKMKIRQKRMKRGKGLEKKFIPYNENIVYEYYDDPNELCDRLRLLISSKSAGNSNHDQEINSIIEELRELDIIV